jgi:hypothetical protein
MYSFVNKKDRPIEVQQRPKRSDHEAWVALGNEEKCVDCAAQRPLDAELEGNWRGFIPLSG